MDELSFTQQEKLAKIKTIIISIISGIFICVITGGLLAGCPKYNVWQQGLKGMAELRRAEQNRQVAIEEAKAKDESAEYYASAEIKRAHGVAGANQIIGESLKENEEYLRYLWIQGLQDGSSEVIYVPTEANLPILEATRKIQNN